MTQGAEEHRRTQGRQVHPGTQGWLRSCQDARSASRGKILSASLLTQASQASPGKFRLLGQTKTVEKERCGEVRALTRERRELKPIGLAMKFTPSHASLSSHFD